MYEEKLNAFAALVQKEQLLQLLRSNYSYEGNERDCRVELKTGRQYAKIDVGSSGKYMVDKNGNIFGIKAYGVVHKEHKYGTLDTTGEYYWGKHKAEKKETNIN